MEQLPWAMFFICALDFCLFTFMHLFHLKILSTPSLLENILLISKANTLMYLPRIWPGEWPAKWDCSFLYTTTHLHLYYLKLKKKWCLSLALDQFSLGTYLLAVACLLSSIRGFPLLRWCSSLQVALFGLIYPQTKSHEIWIPTLAVSGSGGGTWALNCLLCKADLVLPAFKDCSRN